ncbi:C6 transcription factor protein [Rutstroemia sp. NJR-2017a BBW]|nr:C6 transcription factor protein [Rutstroemia sp. NJR-2017a BBW]
MFSTILPNDTSQLTRRSHKKAKTGCTKCKERKLKCDEAKPICLNCTRHFLVPQPCDYPQDMPSRKRKSPSSDSSRVSSRTPEYDAVTKMYIRVSLPGALSAEMIDPFETYPETNVKEFSAMRLEKQQGQRRAATIELGRECIRLLKTRVEKEALVSDQTISAVAMLAAIEHEKGNVRMMRMHMAGLSRMVDLVGGLNAIRERNPMIANSVFWTFTVAMYELPYPCFDPTLPEFYPADHNLSLVENARIYSHFQDFAPDLNNPTLASMQASDFNLTEPIAIARYSIQHVSHLVPKHSTYPTASTSLVILTRICTILAVRTSARIYRSTNPDDRKHTSCASPSHLHTLAWTSTRWHSNHQPHPPPTHRQSETPPNRNPPNFDRVLMLWILSVGGVAADGSPERRWFVSHLGDLTEDLGIQCWKEMKGNISSVVWHEILCENIHRRLWEEVKRKRDEVLELV